MDTEFCFLSHFFFITRECFSKIWSSLTCIQDSNFGFKQQACTSMLSDLRLYAVDWATSNSQTDIPKIDTGHVFRKWKVEKPRKEIQQVNGQNRSPECWYDGIKPRVIYYNWYITYKLFFRTDHGLYILMKAFFPRLSKTLNEVSLKSATNKYIMQIHVRLCAKFV